MKKTALTQLIEQWEESKPKGSHGLIWQVFIDEASELLETEREQIEAAFIDGCKVGVDFEKSQVQVILCEWPNSEQYYKDTYE